MTIVAMAVALWRLNSELGPLRNEVRRLRDEGGHLVVEDISKLHAIRVATVQPDTWRYRVWVPEGKKFWLKTEQAEVPQHGIPSQISSGGSTLIPAGEHLVNVFIQPHPDQEKSLLATIMLDNTRRSTGTLLERKHDWIDNQQVGGRLAGWSGVDPQVEIIEPSQPLVLLKYRASAVRNIRRNAEGAVVGHSSEIIEEPCEGLLLWIDSKP